MAKKLEDYSKEELIELIEAYNLMTQIRNYQKLSKSELIKQIREKFDVDENGKITTKDLSAYPREFNKLLKGAETAKSENIDINKLIAKRGGIKGRIERLKKDIEDYDLDKSSFYYEREKKELEALKDKLEIEKSNLKKINDVIKKADTKQTEIEKEKESKSKLKKMKYTDFIKYYFLKHKGENNKDMMKNASQYWKDIKDEDHTKYINEYQQLLKSKEDIKPEYGTKKFIFDKDGLLSDSDVKYLIRKRMELKKMIDDAKIELEDYGTSKKNEKKREKLKDQINEYTKEFKYFNSYFVKHLNRQTEIDNAPTEDEDEEFDFNLVYMFTSNGDILASAKTSKELKQKIKDNYDAPKKDSKFFLVKFDFEDKKLDVQITQVTITPKMFIAPKGDDAFMNFTYSKEEYDKYGFNIDILKKMINAINKNLVNFEKSSISISELLKLKK